jgi:hypothetical protein
MSFSTAQVKIIQGNELAPTNGLQLKPRTDNAGAAPLLLYPLVIYALASYIQASRYT